MTKRVTINVTDIFSQPVSPADRETLRQQREKQRLERERHEMDRLRARVATTSLAPWRKRS